MAWAWLGPQITTVENIAISMQSPTINLQIQKVTDLNLFIYDCEIVVVIRFVVHFVDFISHFQFHSDLYEMCIKNMASTGQVYFAHNLITWWVLYEQRMKTTRANASTMLSRTMKNLLLHVNYLEGAIFAQSVEIDFIGVTKLWRVSIFYRFFNDASRYRNDHFSHSQLFFHLLSGRCFSCSRATSFPISIFPIFRFCAFSHPRRSLSSFPCRQDLCNFKT